MGRWSDLEKKLVRKIAKWTAVAELVLHELVLKSRAKWWVTFVCLSWVSNPKFPLYS